MGLEESSEILEISLKEQLEKSKIHKGQFQNQRGLKILIFLDFHAFQIPRAYPGENAWKSSLNLSREPMSGFRYPG